MGMPAQKIEVCMQSELEALQYRLLAGEAVDGQAIGMAVREDLNSGQLVSSRYLTVLLNQADISEKEIIQIMGELRMALSSPAMMDPDLFLSYAQSSIACMKAIQRIGS